MFFLVLGCIALANRCDAQLKLEGLSPQAVSTSGKTQVEAEGSFPTWPVEVYCDRKDVMISCEEQKGMLRVELQDCPQGIVWIRLYDRHSASKLVPLLLEAQDCYAESEPNDRPEAAQSLTGPASISGRLAKSEDVDCYLVPLQIGQSLFATVLAKEILDSPMDAVMQICDEDGNVLAQSDDERGLDPQLRFTAKRAGNYVVRLFAFPETPNSTIGFAGGKTFNYVLRMTDSPQQDHAFPFHWGGVESETLSINSLGEDHPAAVLQGSEVSPCLLIDPGSLGWQWLPRNEGVVNRSELKTEAQSGEVYLPPIHVAGHIGSLGEVDRYSVTLEESEKYRFEVLSQSLGFKMDPSLQLVDPSDRKVLASATDISRNNYDARLDFTPKTSGPVEVRVEDATQGFGVRHAYLLGISKVRPSVALNTEAGAAVLEAGKEVAIPVAVDRRDGYGVELELQVAGLPEGVSCSPLVSQANGDSSKAVSLKLTAEEEAQAFQGWVQPIAIEKTDSNSQIPVHFQLRPQVQLDKIWLTVVAPGK